MRDPELKPCGCCEPPAPPTPEKIENRPRLPAIRYRVGTYASFRQAMIEAIAGRTELRGWTARMKDDYGIALLEMWAYLGDILTFYQERIANEAFMRTALLRESVLRLAALLDYEPAPGMAATAYLAFTLEEDATVQIPVGLLVQSVPGQDEKPQKFEAVEAITADARLNQVRVLPELEPRNPLEVGSTQGTLHPHDAEAVAAELVAGDRLVVFSRVGSPGVEEKEVEALEIVDWRTVLTWSPAIQAVGWTLSGASMFKWVRKFRLFGYNAPKSYLKAEPVSPGYTEIRWTEVKAWDTGYKFKIYSGTTLNLDAVYDDLKVGTHLLISAPDFTQLTRVTVVGQVAASKGPLNATVTQITLAHSVQAIADLRKVTIYELAGPEITFWNRRYPDTISGDANTVYVPLSQLDGLESERSTLILDDKETRPQMVAVISADKRDTDGDGQKDHVVITFTPALTRSLDSKTAVLYGNVVKATHGETVADEVLGSGDASIEFQSFAVKKSPVTFVPQPGAPHGAKNTLEVRVGGVLWHEKNTLYGHEGDERVYTTTVDNEGVMTVQFGDGITGARLPGGRNNAVATYRQSLGRDGNIKARSLTTLLDRPVGLKSVTNPADAQGGADPETLEEARTNAPNTVRTFGRIVSLRDFEDVAREFAGVAKARATWVWDGEDQVVHLTVAGDEGDPITSDTYENLVKDLNSRRDPNRKMIVESYHELPTEVEASIQVDPDYVDEDVQAATENALQNYFAFENLDLGQPIHLSDIYRVLQEVEGVVAVDINRLQFKRGDDRVSHGATEEPVQGHLRIFSTELAVIEDPTADAVVKVGIEQP